MAVVQISRIQVRRGKKNAGSGIPQLASGEFGWAVDERELYIGNGSISEGAPTVGNTRILTEYSDILGVAAKYAYKREELTTGVSGDIERSLQAKLDDIVNVRDFGANGDGTIQTAALQRAIDALYLGSNKGLYESHITLYMPAGEYKIDAPLYLPPFARIIGDGKGATYINSTGTHAFYTVNEDSTPGNPAGSELVGTPATTFNNQARNILLQGMTILDTTYQGALILQNCRDSIFRDIELIGQFDPSSDSPYINGTDSSGGYIDYTAIKLNALSSSVTCSNNKFEDCNIKNFIHPVYSDYDVVENFWDRGEVNDTWFGFVFGLTTLPSADTPGQLTGPSHNTISNYVFDNVYEEAILVREGTNNLSKNNKFYDVGNRGGGPATATTACIRFGYLRSEVSEARFDPRFHVGNKSISDYFQRTEELTVNGAYNTGDYPPEVEGAKHLTLDNEIQTRLGTSSNNTVQVADISQADPCVVRTFTNHNFENGQQVLLTGLTGMTELEGRTFWINIVDSDEFELYNDAGLTSSEDSTGHTVYGSGGAAVGSVRTYFMQLPADQRRGTILVDYVYDAVLSTNEINRKGTWTVIYDLDNNDLSFSETYTATGDAFYVPLLEFTANLVTADYKVTFSFSNTGFSLGSDTDNFRFTVKHIV